MLVYRYLAGSTRNVLAKKCFRCSYTILAMLTLESKVDFLLFFLHHILVVRVVLTFLPTVLSAGFTRLRYNRPSNKPMEKYLTPDGCFMFYCST